MQSPSIRAAASGRHRSATSPWILGLVLTLALTLTACGSTSARPSATATPFLASGQTGIFASFVSASKSGTPTEGPPPGQLVALHASDGTPVWSAPTTGPAMPLLFSNGVLFTSLETFAKTTTSEPTGSIEALRASDGKQLWQSASGAVTTPLAVDSSAVYALTLDFSTQQSQLQALGVADGKVLWNTSFSSAKAAGGPGTATLAAGTLYLVSFGQPTANGPSTTLTAIRTSDGTTLWSISLPGEFNSPAINKGTVYVSGMTFTAPTGPTSPMPTPTVVALRATDGTQLWTHPLSDQGAEGLSQLRATDTAVCVAVAVGLKSTPGGPPLTASLIALNPTTGAELWHAPVPGIANSLLEDNGTLYLASLDLNAATGGSAPAGTIAAFHESDGKQLWSQAQQDGPANIVAVTNGSLVALAASQSATEQVTGEVEAVSTADGTAQWKYAIPNGGPVTAVIGAA